MKMDGSRAEAAASPWTHGTQVGKQQQVPKRSLVGHKQRGGSRSYGGCTCGERDKDKDMPDKKAAAVEGGDDIFGIFH